MGPVWRMRAAVIGPVLQGHSTDCPIGKSGERVDLTGTLSMRQDKISVRRRCPGFSGQDVDDPHLDRPLDRDVSSVRQDQIPTRRFSGFVGQKADGPHRCRPILSPPPPSHATTDDWAVGEGGGRFPCGKPRSQLGVGVPDSVVKKLMAC